MKTKTVTALLLALCLLLAGCAAAQEPSTPAPTSADVPASTAAAETARTVFPLPDTTMLNLTDAVLSVSLEKGGVYVDNSGTVQMDLTVYTYDMYDMVDIASLAVGDLIAGHAGETAVASLERNDAGTVFINGGLENGGFDLVTDNSGIFYEMGYNDSQNWYVIGNITVPVAADFRGIDNADLENRDVSLNAESFLNDAVTNYDFTPLNTTVRIENGQIIELNRRYTP